MRKANGEEPMRRLRLDCGFGVHSYGDRCRRGAGSGFVLQSGLTARLGRMWCWEKAAGWYRMWCWMGIQRLGTG